VRIELEQEVQNIDEQQYHTRAPADLEDLGIGIGRVGEGSVKGRWEQQTGNSKRQEACAHLRDSTVVDLLSESQATKQKAHAQDEQQIRQDGAKYRSLDDSNLVLHQCDDKDDQLDGISECDIHERANGVSQPHGNALGGVTEESSKGYDGYRVHGENNASTSASEVDGNTDRHKHQQNINVAGQEDVLEGEEEPNSHIFVGSGSTFAQRLSGGCRRRLYRRFGFAAARYRPGDWHRVC
jgi:hypothetical protein